MHVYIYIYIYIYTHIKTHAGDCRGCDSQPALRFSARFPCANDIVRARVVVCRLRCANSHARAAVVAAVVRRCLCVGRRMRASMHGLTLWGFRVDMCYINYHYC